MFVKVLFTQRGGSCNWIDPMTRAFVQVVVETGLKSDSHGYFTLGCIWYKQQMVSRSTFSKMLYHLQTATGLNLLILLWSQFYAYQRWNIPIVVQNIYGIDVILLYIHQTRILFFAHPMYFLSVQLLPPTLQTMEFLFLSRFIYLCIDVDMLRY